MGAEDEAAERKKRLEEKRKKIAEIRARRAAAEQTGQQVKELSGLLGDDDAMPADKNAGFAATSAEAGAMGIDGGAKAEMPTNAQTKQSVKAPKLTASKKNANVIDIPPQVSEMYAKETQTIVADPSADDISIPMNEERSPRSSGKFDGLRVPSPAPFRQRTGATGMERSGSFSMYGQQPNVEVSAKRVLEEMPPARRKEVFAREDFRRFFDWGSKAMERIMAENARYDPLVNYALTENKESKESDKREMVAARTVLFDDKVVRNRAVTDIRWSAKKHPELLLSSYHAIEGPGQHSVDGAVLLWNVMMPTHPEMTFYAPCPVLKTTFSPYHPQLIIGGTYAGQILIWDMREGPKPFRRTAIGTNGHTHPIFALELVGSENAHSLVSISSDGRLCVWSLDMLMQPQETIELVNKQSKQVAVSAMSFPDRVNEVNALLVGSEEGPIYTVYRHGASTGVADAYESHAGPVLGLDCHPPAYNHGDVSDLFLSGGVDWTIKLWSRKIPGALLTMEAQDYVTAVQWSPVHPALFSAAEVSGHVSLYNLNVDVEAPLVRFPMSERGINALRFSDDGHLIAGGDTTGRISVYELSTEVANPRPDDYKKLDEIVMSYKMSAAKVAK